MALINIREVYPGVSLGLWQIEERIEDFCKEDSWMVSYVPMLNQKYKNEERKLEFLATRALLHEMLLRLGCSEKQIQNMGDISHNPQGKPLLKGYNISISHTRGYVSVILSKNKKVAVDIEYISNRVERVASKFLRKDEKAFGLDSLLVHWCCKETMYKLFSEEQLGFSDMKVLPFDALSDWSCEVVDLRTKATIRMDFELTMEFVLTYTAM